MPRVNARAWQLALGLTSLGLTAGSAACQTELPGDVVGAYKIRMQLQENNCGNGVVLNEDRYTAELRAGEPPRGFWRVPKSAAIEGRYEDGGFTFQVAETRDLGSADAGTSGCTIFREELLEGTVVRPNPVVDRDAGSQDAGAHDGANSADASAALAARHRISFRTNPNGRCKDHPGPLGPFERLPCSALYDVQGDSTKPFGN